MTTKTEQESASRTGCTMVGGTNMFKLGTPTTVWRGKKQVQNVSGMSIWNTTDVQYAKTLQDMLILKCQGYTIETITEIL